MKNLTIALLLLLGISAYAQTPTIGLLYNNSDASPGYTLFTPEQSNNVYLVNNCGELVNLWTFSEIPGATCYLLENGNLLRAGKDAIEIRDWNSNLIWSYATTNNGLLQHHDIHPMPNGNILCLLTDEYSNLYISSLGRDPSNTDENFKIDKIVELEPIGENGANIVWEWKFVDHLIQDFDDTKENYGIVEDHPELLDINFDNGQTQDWTHVNAIEYNAELDQILITARHLSELYIIDHSTTTEEAAGHNAGNNEKGGDFLWRWGNPQVYRQGTSDDQKLKWPHDAKWVKESYLDAGKISVFNNNFDGTGDHSLVHLIKPEIENNSYVMENNIFLPESYDWSWSGELMDEVLFSSKKSGVHSLPNGNIIICEYLRSTIFEITKDGELLWAYKNPVGEIIYNQFGDYDFNTIGIFRGEKYPPNFPGFIDVDLSTNGSIENINELSAACRSADLIEIEMGNSIKIVNSIISNEQILFNQSFTADQIKIIDLNGRILQTITNFSGNSISINLKPGLYLVQIISDNNNQLEKIIIP